MSFGNNGIRDERGVSESIGFMLIFTLVIVGIGLVTLYGYPMLLQQQVNADLRIMEKNLIVLQNDFKSITFKSAPYKETSLKVGGGRLTIYNTTDKPTSSSFRVSDGGSVNVTSTRASCSTNPSMPSRSSLLKTVRWSVARCTPPAR